MEAVLKQLLLWPPKSSTVVGLGLLFGLGSYYATGSWTIAIGLAGAFKVICPQDVGATDKLDELLQMFGKTPPVLLCALVLAGGLSACSMAAPAVPPAATANAAAVEQRIVEACAFSGLFDFVNGSATSLAPVPGLAVVGQLVDAGVDKVCANPGRFAGDASTVVWLAQNFKSLTFGQPGPAPAVKS